MDFGIRWASDAVWLGETSFPNTGRLAADLRPTGEVQLAENPLFHFFAFNFVLLLLKPEVGSGLRA
jgi:hypothetical protein